VAASEADEAAAVRLVVAGFGAGADDGYRVLAAFAGWCAPGAMPFPGWGVLRPTSAEGAAAAALAAHAARLAALEASRAAIRAFGAQRGWISDSNAQRPPDAGPMSSLEEAWGA